MNLSGLDNKYIQWLNSLPVAKNSAGQNAGASTIRSGNSPTDMDKILYSGEVVKSDIRNYTGMPITETELVPSSERDYTIEDALNYQYNRQFTIKLDDLMSGSDDNIRLRNPGSPVPQEFIDSLKQNGIAEESYDAGWSDFYISGLDSADTQLENSVEYLASGYAVSKEHIEDSYSGEEKERLLSQLKSEFGSAVDSLADKAAKEIGGFFEENGASGEIQKIHDSILNAYQDTVEKYSDYMKDGKDYAGLGGTENEWLKNDNSYMAGRLRKALKADESAAEKTDGKGYYSLDELEKAQYMVSEIRSDSNEINDYDDEEQIGYKLAGISLKGEVFNKFSGVSAGLKDIVSNSIHNFVTNMTDKLNKQLRKDRAVVAEPEKMADFSETDIFTVYNRVMDIYKATGDMIKALKDGAVFGNRQHMDKAKDDQYSSLSRYGSSGSTFWNNFFQNTLKYREDPLIPPLISESGYIDKESGIETLSKDWNSFVSKFTDDSSIKLSAGSFSVYA